MSYVGIDIHSNKFTAYFKEDGGRNRVKTYYINKENLKNFVDKDISENDYVFIEAYTNTFAALVNNFV